MLAHPVHLIYTMLITSLHARHALVLRALLGALIYRLNTALVEAALAVRQPTLPINSQSIALVVVHNLVVVVDVDRAAVSSSSLPPNLIGLD